MKKTFLTLAIGLGITYSSLAQKEVKFEMKFSPNTVYTSTLVSHTSTEMDFEADSAQMAQMKAGGMELPMMIKGEQKVISTTRTGSPNEDKAFHFTTSYDDFQVSQTLNGKTMNPPSNLLAGTKTYGNVQADGKIHTDSISGPNLPEEMKSAIVKMTEEVFEKIKFPEEPMKVGDEFSQELPINLPIPGIPSTQMKSNTHYKLVDIKKGMAYFDIDQKIDMNMDMSEKGALSMNGAGTGKAIYNIKMAFLVKYDVDMQMEMNMDIEKMKMMGKINSNTQMEIAISPNE